MAGDRKLFLNPDEDFGPLLLESEAEVEQGARVFRRALALWQEIKGFDSAFTAREIAA